MASIVGRTLGGKTEIRSLLGQGGMATVYLGYQRDLDRQVAVKVLPPHPGLNAMFIERFQLEARTVARLQHPHILQLFDYGVEDDILFLVTPYIPGGSLEDVMRDGRLEAPYIERVLNQISGALDYAHRQGVIHRDLKPGNILLDGDGNALLADFGIAKITGDTGNLTGTGVVGTPAYMSPEQCQGLPIDSRSDIYSLGVVIYEMLTGKQPYQADTPVQVMMKHVYDPAPDITTIAPALSPGAGAVMLRVLAKDPGDRYQTASAFAKDLGDALRDQLPTGDGRPTTTARAASTAAPASTTRANDPARSETTRAESPTGYVAPNSTQQPTIIVQQSANTGVLVAGFAVIAVLILVIGFIIVMLLRNNQQPEPAVIVDLIRERLAQGTLPPELVLTAQAVLPLGEGVDAPVGTAIAAALSPNAPATATPSLTPPPASVTTDVVGRATFGLTDAAGDSLNVRLARVTPPGQGKVYVAWLGNGADGEIVNIGRIAIDASGEGATSYIDPEGRFLPAAYSSIRITLEDIADENAAAPVGPVVYAGEVPSEIAEVMGELFVESAGGFNGRGLLESAVREARFAQQHAGYASDARNVVGMRTHAEHTLQILIGGEEDFDGNGRVGNPGTGIGLYAYLDRIDTIIAEAEALPAISPTALSEIENMRICLANVRRWTDDIVALERDIVGAARMGAVDAQLAESTDHAGKLIEGFDQNENGFVDLSENECGLFQAGAAALLIATIEIRPAE